MADALPASKTALRRMASRARSMARSRARERAEQRETRWEYAGAFLVLPLAKSVMENFELFDLGLDEKLRVGLVTGLASTFVGGMASDALRGASLGAIGAYSWDAKQILGGLFGKK